MRLERMLPNQDPEASSKARLLGAVRPMALRGRELRRDARCADADAHHGSYSRSVSILTRAPLSASMFTSLTVLPCSPSGRISKE